MPIPHLAKFATSTPSRPAPQITMELVWIDPDAAELLLGTIDHQRNLRVGHVIALSSDAKHGRWKDSHQAIALDEDGSLIDGQHRLRMVVDTGIPQWFWVAQNVPSDVMGVIDTAAGRSAADALKLGEVVDRSHPTVAAAARTAILWEDGHHRKVRANVNGARKVTNSEIAEWVENQLAATASAVADTGALPITQAVADANSWTGITARTAISASVLAFALLLIADVDQSAAYEFFTALDRQDFNPDNDLDPIRQLIDREAYALNNREGLRISEHLFLIITAFNAWQNGDDVKYVTMSSGKIKPVARVLQPRKSRSGVITPLVVPDPVSSKVSASDPE